MSQTVVFAVSSAATCCILQMQKLKQKIIVYGVSNDDAAGSRADLLAMSYNTGQNT